MKMEWVAKGGRGGLSTSPSEVFIDRVKEEIL
jgi:hypothetical protein